MKFLYTISFSYALQIPSRVNHPKMESRLVHSSIALITNGSFLGGSFWMMVYGMYRELNEVLHCMKTYIRYYFFHFFISFSHFLFSELKQAMINTITRWWIPTHPLIFLLLFQTMNCRRRILFQQQGCCCRRGIILSFQTWRIFRRRNTPGTTIRWQPPPPPTSSS